MIITELSNFFYTVLATVFYSDYIILIANFTNLTINQANKDSIINTVKYVAVVFVFVRFIFLLKKVSNLWKK